MDNFVPKLITVFKDGYSRKDFSRDLLAGVIVGVVALPLAIAFAIASGVKPEQGIFTAVIAGFFISAFSGSRFQIGGPTGAFIILVYEIVSLYGYSGLAIATLMAGGLLVVMGFCKMGAIIRYIPYPVTVGFTSAIAVIIGVGQIRDLFGLVMDKVPADFPDKIEAYVHHIDSFNIRSFGIGFLTIAIILLWPRVSKKIPGSIIALILTTALVHCFDIPVESIGSRFGEIPDQLPVPSIPSVDWETCKMLFSPALSIAILAGIESLLSAVVADGMTGRRHRPNIELVAQGFANIFSPLFGGIPATGAIARTATNIKNGACSPIAGIVHAITLFLILIAAGDLARLIPMATLSGILLVVAYHMGEWHLFFKVMKSTKSDSFVLLTTFGLTIFLDLSIAIQVGVVLAAILFMKRMADVSEVRMVSHLNPHDEYQEQYSIKEYKKPDDMVIFDLDGPFFFGAAHKFQTTYLNINSAPRVIIFRMRNVPAMDVTGISALESILKHAGKRKTRLIFSGFQPQALKIVRRSGLEETIGLENIFENIWEAIHAAEAETPEKKESA